MPKNVRFLSPQSNPDLIKGYEAVKLSLGEDCNIVLAFADELTADRYALRDAIWSLVERIAKVEGLEAEEMEIEHATAETITSQSA